MSNLGSVYLIPVPIADGALDTLAPEVKKHIAHIRHYYVENLRTARRFLKAVEPATIIDSLHFTEIKELKSIDNQQFTNTIKSGSDIGIMSEAGCPGIADPGAELVALAHKIGAKVVPLTGPNSIVLALMASGLNGQSFCFHGYLPIKEPARSSKIHELEQRSAKEKQTQIFIETPYRNNTLLEELLRHCKETTLLCIAQNITSETEFIRTLTVSAWKKNKPVLEKAPAVFLLLS
jgi:16S rRNA (cytidine1402-2'-O)-methyltransferase